MEPFATMEDNSSEEIEDNRSDHLNLLGMPSLIIDSIMGNINLSDILNLRLTCKTTKAWADKSKFLCKLRIHIHSTSTINKLLSHQTETPWNNFDFKCNLSRWKDQQPIQGFTCNFGNQIQVLEFSVVRSRDTPGILQILIGCTSLKRLIINKLNCTYLESLCPQKKVGLSKSLRNLDQLGVYKLMCHHPSDADSFMRYVLLQCVSSLKSVAIPVIKFPRTAVLLFHKKDELVNNHSPTCTSFYVMSPMIQLFESQARGLQTIVVLPETRRLLSDSALFCLSLLCYNRKIHLVYGTMAGSQLLTLGRLNYHLSAHPTMSEIASKILTVMGATTDLLLNHEFKNLRTLLVQFKSFNINQDLFVVQDFPKLNVVCMDFQRHEGNEVQLRRMNMFVQGILDVKRPSVKQFMVQHHDEVESWVQLCPTKISIAFANLNEIALISWNGLDDSFLVLWRNLKLLKKVDVKNCPHLTDRGILGADLVNPAMKNLKYLKDLMICNVGRITDLSYLMAFKDMRLTKFHHTAKHHWDVSKVGYDALGEGDFHLFIKFFTGTTTYFGCTKRSQLRAYLDRFESLIDPEKDKILKEFTIRKRITRLRKPFSHLKWITSTLPLGAHSCNVKYFVPKAD